MQGEYTGTSLIRNTPLLGPYSRTTPIPLCTLFHGEKGRLALGTALEAAQVCFELPRVHGVWLG